MDKRLVRFLVIASVAFLLTTLLQPILFPPRPKANPGNNVAADSPDGAKQDQQPAGEAEKTQPQTEADPAAANQQPGGLAAAPPADQVAAIPPPPPRPLHPNQLVTLGTYGESSPDKLVATFNTRGAAIHRIELNSRTKKGALRYRDLESKGAFIGQLEISDDNGVCRVNSVTPGTAAASGGIQVSDIITHVNAEPVVSPSDFVRLLGQIRPGTAINVTIARGAANDRQSLDVSLTGEARPLEVLGPRTGQVYDPSSPIPPSMLVTLRQKSTGAWPELDEAMRTADWQVAELSRDGKRVIEFSLDLPASGAAQQPAHGPLRAVKRYWLPDATSNDDFEPNFHVVMELEFQNLADTPQEATFEVLGPTGTNIEGWWYQNKIHGRSSAVFQVAGARDIVSSNANRPFYFWGGPEIVKNFLSQAPVLQEVFAANITPPENKAMRYVGVDTQYFATVLMPHIGKHPSEFDPADSFRPYSAFTHVIDTRDAIPRNNRLQRTVDLTFRLFSDQFKLGPTQTGPDGAHIHRQQFEVFAGPKESQLLRKYNLNDLISFGWFAWVSRPLLGFLWFFYNIFGNYGIAIVLLTVFVRLLIFPISRRAQMNAAKHAKMMQFLQPEIKKIQERFKDNLEKRAKAQNELFKKFNYSPLSMFGGCLLMFLQLPIFIGLYRGLSVDIALRGQPLIPGLRWCSNLAGPDQFLNWQSWIPFGLANEQGLFGPYLNILPLITIALFLVQTKLFSPPPTDDQQRMAQRVMTLTMLFMGVLFFKVPSGLCIYFITSSVWGILERQFIPKPQLPAQFANLDSPGAAAGASGQAERHTASPASLTNDKERESRRKLDRDRQRRLRESQQ